MSNKIVNENEKNITKKRDSFAIAKVLVLVVAIIFVILVVLAVTFRQGESAGIPKTSEENHQLSASESSGDSQSTENMSQSSASQESIQIEIPEDVSFDLGDNLEITDMGAYTGIYMEDGTDEIVSGIMMIVVTNHSENTLQYAEIKVSGEDSEASFSLSTLMPGASAVVLEKNRLKFKESDKYTTATAENVTFFSEDLSLHEDVLKIQPLDGALNVTNISDKDISGEVIIYYKNSAADMFYGGITYRARVEGGLKAGETKQVMTNHFSAKGSTILFVTYVNE